MTLNDPTAPWWRHAVCYQVYVRSFADSDGDGIGDLPGITSRLPYLRDLGVDALWITPFYTSPQNDHGYDVADYCDIDPLFGSLDDADHLVRRAHDLGLRVIVDLVPNHTSSEHEWFQAALAAGPGSPERERYHFVPVDPENPDTPPNNWKSVFGGPAWTKAEAPEGADFPAEWYLHIFDSTQPDLNWRNPAIGDMFEGVLRFWLDRGVDGFRIDVAHGLFKAAGLPDEVLPEETDGETVHVGEGSMVERGPGDEPMWDQPEVHDVYRRWRKILEEYDGDRMAVAEAWTKTTESMARYVRPDELHQAFNFSWLLAEWSAESFAEVVTGTLDAVDPVGASPTWVLSNHDVVRHPSRYGAERGHARARAATLAMLALPGSAYVYQGEELGLEQVEVEPEFRQDPSWFRTGEPGRDGCRVPIPWGGDEPPFEFGPGEGQPWIPQPAEWKALTVEAQEADPESTLAFYRRALATRREAALPEGDRVQVAQPSPLGADVLDLRRGNLRVLLNCGDTAVDLPEGEVVIASGTLPGGKLPADTAVWLR
ncbi:glycoside hydrolase family 13 protein [Nocardioides sp. GCM10027113]|uniref:glycoside hydrolase family 13 protein n=1 Tax=unclassified Nocardioides TaxID=2615069 RepID=UPI0036064AFB